MTVLEDFEGYKYFVKLREAGEARLEVKRRQLRRLENKIKQLPDPLPDDMPQEEIDKAANLLWRVGIIQAAMEEVRLFLKVIYEMIDSIEKDWEISQK